MTEKVLQCCYTNANKETGGKLSSGWQPVSVSKDIPAEAFNMCVGLQNANSAIQKEMLDEHGKVLNLYEINGDGSYIYVMRTQYGLLDRLGRANMFSHAFVLSWKDESVLCDPNSFLTIQDENFKQNENDADSIPAALIRGSKFSIIDALEISGLNNERYLKLIQCVFSQMTEKKTSEPLFIQYDGSHKQMKALLFCIYYGIPYYLRKKLCVASSTANNDINKNIIFSEKAQTKSSYFIPETGDNNLLNGRIERKISRYGFADYVARNYNTLDAVAYYKELEKFANELGDNSASNELILKIAHQLMINAKIDTYSNDELDSIVSDALRSRSQCSVVMENYIAALVSEVQDRSLFLSEESEINLSERLSSAIAPEFNEAGVNYNLYRICSFSVADAAAKLNKMSSREFEIYSKRMSQMPKGIEILDEYYSRYAIDYNSLSWNQLNKALDESGYVKERPKTENKIGDSAWELYCDEIKTAEKVSYAFSEYATLMGKLIPSSQMESCKNSAKEKYWESVDFSTFDMGNVAIYNLMKSNSKRYILFAEFYKVLYSLSSQSDEAFLLLINTYFSKHPSVLDEDTREIVFSQIEKAIATRYIGKDKNLIRWVNAVSFIMSKDLFNEIIRIRDLLYSARYSDMANELLQLLSVGPLWSRDSSSIIRIISGNIVTYCDQIETEKRIIPLDLWLAVGSSRHENAFEIFDEFKPYVLVDNEDLIVAESALLKRPQYIKEAEEYVKNRGSEFKTVKRWLSKLTQIVKQKETEAKKEALKTSKPVVKPNRQVPYPMQSNTKTVDTENSNQEEPQERKNLFKGLFKRK